jgi:predicted glycosyltransferase
MRVMVYSHDAFGLGNIRRMLSICQHLLKTIPDVSILVVSGSPALHSLRLPAGLDYIKLPCVSRDESGELSSRYLNTEVEGAVKLRSDLILAAALNFKPDLFLVDKKPDGLQGELQSTIHFLRDHRPEARLVLLLRDILDAPAVTIAQWQRHGYPGLIETFYHQVWVVGTPEVFDICREYQFPAAVASKIRYCGYIARERGAKSRAELRQEWQIPQTQPLVVVTPGGGGDGYRLVKTYLEAIALNAPSPSENPSFYSLIVSGPDMPPDQQAEIRQRVAQLPTVQLLEFTDDMVSYLAAADVVVSMGGYNTVCEILTLRKRAIVVPRTQPVAEQAIRAERMAKLGTFCTLHPETLTPETLRSQLDQALDPRTPMPPDAAYPDMEGLSRLADYLISLLGHRAPTTPFPWRPPTPKTYHPQAYLEATVS